MKFLVAIALFATFSLAPLEQQAAETSQRVYYLSGIHTLNGYLYKPEGKGPFPVAVFNQASLNIAGQQKPFATLAQMFTSKGWIFFVPGRHQLGPTNEKLSDFGGEERVIREHEKQVANISAAVAWIKTESYVDARRIVMIGEAAGAVSSLLAGEKDFGLCAMVLFAPGTQMLKNDAMKLRMRLALQNARAPIFLIQTQNDYNLLPAEVLGLELEKKGGVDRVKVYPAHGTLPSHAQKFPTEGYAVWQTDFFAFVGKVLEARTVAHQTAN